MQLQVSGQHVEVTPALLNYVEKQINNVNRKFNNITNIHVVLSVDSHLHKAEATINLSKSPEHIFAQATTNNMYASIDGLSKKLNRQVTKHKELLKDHTEH